MDPEGDLIVKVVETVRVISDPYGFAAGFSTSPWHPMKRHGQAPWYFSFMGRPDERDAQRKAYLARKGKRAQVEPTEIIKEIQAGKKAAKGVEIP